jgi:hypothetical protein
MVLKGNQMPKTRKKPVCSDESAKGQQIQRLTVRSRQPKSLVQFFRESPLMGVELDLTRDKDTDRDIEL